MAISLGAAALSFAGGVAEGINTKVEKEHASRLRREERAEEMRDLQKMRIDESRYTSDKAKFDKQEEHVAHLKSVEGDQKATQRYIIEKIQGRNWEGIQQQILNGDTIPPATYNASLTSPVFPGTDFDHLAETKGIVATLFGGKVKESDVPTEKAVVEATTPTAPRTFGGQAVDMKAFVEANETVTVDGKIGQLVLQDDGTKKFRLIKDVRADAAKKGTPLPGTYTLPDSDEEFTLLQQKDGSITTVGGKPVDATDFKLKGQDTKDPNAIPGRWVDKNNEQVGVFWKNGKVVDVDSKPVDMRELRLVDDPQALAQGNTFYRNKKNPNEVIKPIFDAKSPTGFIHLGKPVDLEQWTPITTDSLTATAAKNTRRTDAVTASNTALGNLNQGLEDYSRIISEGLKGPAGVVLDVGSALSGTISGVGELVGVEAVPLAERIALIEESDIDINEFIGGDKTALRGMAKQDAQLLIYSLAGVLKQNANQDRTGVADIKAATNMIRALSATDSGLGATRSLQGFINTKIAGNNQELYQMPGVDTRKRAQSGINLLRLTTMKEKGRWREAIDNRRIGINDVTGEISVTYPPVREGQEPITRTLDQIIMFEGVNGSLRPERLINVR